MAEKVSLKLEIEKLEQRIAPGLIHCGPPSHPSGTAGTSGHPAGTNGSAHGTAGGHGHGRGSNSS